MSDDQHLSTDCPVGWIRRDGKRVQLRLPFETLHRHMLVTGASGWGKSAFLLSLLLPILSRNKHAKICVVDAKGELVRDMIRAFLPAMAGQPSGLVPDDACIIAPFSSCSVPLNPCAPRKDLDPAVQARLIVELVDGLIEGGIGPRGQSILGQLCRAAIEIPSGSLLVILDMLRSDTVRLKLASQIRSPDVRAAVMALGKESRPSMDSLISRLEFLTMLPGIRAALCSPRGSIDGSAMLESRLTLVDLGGAPFGSQAIGAFVGQLVLSLVTGAIFDRPAHLRHTPVFLVIDEWQELLRFCHQEIERLLALSRYKGVSLWLANQATAQIRSVSKNLLDIVVNNIALHMAFRPDLSDLTHLESILPLTGNRINPVRPDAILSRREERAYVLDQLCRLPPRSGLLGNFVTGDAQVIQTLEVPYAEAGKRTSQLPEDECALWQKGRFGIPIAELIAETDAAAGRAAAPTSSPSARLATKVPVTQPEVPRSARPKLEV